MMFWLLAREVLRLKGKVSRKQPWDTKVDLFFYRDPEAAKKEAENKETVQGVTADAEATQADAPKWNNETKEASDEFFSKSS